MFKIRSLVGRLAVAKTAGFILGGIAFFGLSLMGAESSTIFNLGIWLMSILMGVMIGFIGLLDEHPIMHFKMPFYLRGAIVGASFFLLLPLLAMDQMAGFMQLEFVQWFGVTSPWWVVLEGAVWGILIAWLTTTLCGEGKMPIS